MLSLYNETTDVTPPARHPGAWQLIWVDGVKNTCQWENGVLYIDAPELRQRRCRAIRIDKTTWQMLSLGRVAVGTSGVHLSTIPPKEGQPVSEVKPRRRPSLLAKIVNVIKEHYR